MVAGVVDRLEDIPDRLDGLFRWDAARAASMVSSDANPEAARRVVEAFAREIADTAALDRDTFRAAAQRVRQATGCKGRDLFHPIRDALTAAGSGPELDLIVPAIDRAAALPAGVIATAVASCRERAGAVARRLASAAV
jgi:glutamyl-tRNA synthetase/nondiscriminating glutamyl-tRNA synthetase